MLYLFDLDENWLLSTASYCFTWYCVVHVIAVRTLGFKLSFVIRCMYYELMHTIREQITFLGEWSEPV